MHFPSSLLASALFGLTLLQTARPALAAEADWLSDADIQKARQASVLIGVEAEPSPSGPKSGVSGFFVSEDGLVVTCASSLEGAAKLTVRVGPNKSIPVTKVLAFDPDTDLAVLATGEKAPAYLTLDDRPAQAGEPCASVFQVGGGDFKATDGKLISRREALNWSETGYLEVWTVGIRPGPTGLTGAPLVTRGGRVAGMCDFTGQLGPAICFAIPEKAIAAILTKARANRKPLALPKFGEVNRHSEVDTNSDLDYMAAMQLMAAGNFSAAEQKLRAALPRHPKSALLTGQLGYCALKRGDLDEAQKLLETTLQLDPSRMMVHVRLGEIIGQKGDKAKAAQYFQDLVAKYPKLGVAWGTLAQFQYAAGQKDEAIKSAKKWTELEPESMLAWKVYGDVLSATGDFDGGSKAKDHANEIDSLLFKIRYSAPKRD